MQRQLFLRETLGRDCDCPTTDDLAELAQDTEQRYGNLGGKLAVIYLDGNGFGKLKQAMSASGGDPRILDDTIQGYRRTFLRELIASIRHDRGFLTEGSLRLEILIWGG